MPQPFLTATEVEDNILRDIVSQEPSAETGADSDFRVRAAATGAAVEGLYQSGQWIARQIIPGPDSDKEWIERHAAQRDIYYKAATYAAGTASFAGTVGADVPIGIEVTRNGVLWATTESAVIGGGGVVVVAVRAALPGTAGNALVGAVLTLTEPPPGVTSTAVVVSMAGGTNVETVAGLLARLQDYVRRPPMAGAPHDYERWALEVDGVTGAHCYPLRRGRCTVDVIISTAGGVPSPELIAQVQAYIEERCNGVAELLVMGPAALPVDVRLELFLLPGYLLADVSARVELALQAYFDSLAPGDTMVLTQLIAVIKEVEGVYDFDLAEPLANVTTLVDATHSEQATLGAIDIT